MCTHTSFVQNYGSVYIILQCEYTTVEGKNISYYEGLHFVEKILPKEMDVENLPMGWITVENEGIRLFWRKCELVVNGYSVLEQVTIGHEGDISIQIGQISLGTRI